MNPMHPMAEFVSDDVTITGSVTDGRSPRPYTVYFYRYPDSPEIYEIMFYHVGRNGYVYESSNDPKVRELLITSAVR